MQPALAVIELSSIAAGIVVGDAMAKRATLDVIHAGTIHPGNFLIAVGGPVGEVEEALDAAHLVAAGRIIDEIFLPNVHDEVVGALRGTRLPSSGEALGVLESSTAASIVEAADAGVKGAAVTLREIRLADGLGGKGYLLFGGPVAEVEIAVEVGAARIHPSKLVGAEVIASLHGEMEENLGGAARFRDRIVE